MIKVAISEACPVGRNGLPGSNFSLLMGLSLALDSYHFAENPPRSYRRREFLAKNHSG